MSDFPAELRYTKEHEWARQEGDLLIVGITSHAVEQLGDITMVTLPEAGTALKAGDAFGDVDSVKAVSELYAPLDCEVVECNGALEDAPEAVNETPYTDGWMLKVRPASADAFAEMMDAAAYTAFVGEG